MPLDAPNAAFIRDTLINGARRVVLRVTAPRGATSLVMRASGAPVLTASIDGRVIDTTRFRYRTPSWVMRYWAVPDSGAIVPLSIPVGAKIDFEVVSRVPGIPGFRVTVPPRPPCIPGQMVTLRFIEADVRSVLSFRAGLSSRAKRGSGRWATPTSPKVVVLRHKMNPVAPPGMTTAVR